MAIGAERTGRPPVRCSLLLHSSLRPPPGQWYRCQSCKYTLGATFVIISQNFLIARHKSFGRETIACHNIKHVLWRAIAARVPFYSRPGLPCDLLYREHQHRNFPRSFPTFLVTAMSQSSSEQMLLKSLYLLSKSINYCFGRATKRATAKIVLRALKSSRKKLF